MKNASLIAAMAAVTVAGILVSADAQAQTAPLEVWQPPKSGEMDPAKRVPLAPQPVSTAADEMQPTTTAQTHAYTATEPTPVGYGANRGGFFLGVQGGKGWVERGVEQPALMVNAGYRWQAGAVTLIGIEAASGRLDRATDKGQSYGGLDYASFGVNARFNFGRGNPVYGLLRAGYWAAETRPYGIYGGRETVDGGYVGAGLGVDFTRNFNMSLVYTNHVYFNDYYWDGTSFYYDADRADTLMLGAEFRF